jgi:tetratricopeptide (TPR) repeat protein
VAFVRSLQKLFTWSGYGPPIPSAKIRFSALLALAPCFTFAAPPGTPKILIIPIKKGQTADPPPISIGNYLAQEFDVDGRVRPIVWSIADPTFRDSVQNGIVHVPKDYPNRSEGMAAAKALGAHYVLLYSSVGASKGYSARAELFEDGKEIWHDVQNSGTRHSDALNSEESNYSIAHTWSLQLVGSVFKQLLAHPKLLTPGPSKGNQPPPTAVTPPPPSGGSEEIGVKVKELVQTGHADKAVSLVRDAIDANPFDPKFRIMLVSVYEQNKDWSAAADTAKRGCEVIPDNLQLRRATLKDMILAGRDKDAREELNEILAREPNSSSTKLLESQTYLAVGDYAKATLSLDQAVKRSPSPEAYYWRAMARAAMGGADGVNADIQEYLKKPFLPEEASDSCQECEKILIAVTNRDIALSLNLFQQATLHPDAQETKDQFEQLLNDAVARGDFLQQVPGAAANKQSYGELLLAQKLLVASFASLKEVLKTGNDDSMTDARINLGEAIKATKNSQKLLESEQGNNEVAKPTVDLF